MTTHQNLGKLVLQGIPAAPGITHGPAFVFLQKELEIPLYEVGKHQISSEIKRFEEAIIATKKQIINLRKTVEKTFGEQEAQIFDSHLFILQDKALIEETKKEQERSSYNIDYCFHTIAKRHIQDFSNINDKYIRERLADIYDVAKRVLANLLGHKEQGVLAFTEQKIIVADDLSPSDVAEIRGESVLAVITNSGSRTSHSVIMARSLQVPSVVGLHNATAQITNNDYLIIDGYEGTVIVNPSPEVLAKYERIKRDKLHLQEIYESISSLPSKTTDGHRVSLMVNIGNLQDIKKLHTTSSDGIGLLRTESIFLEMSKSPSEEEQFKIYQNIVQGMNPLPVTIRTLDIGEDKRLGNLLLREDENNPFMGLRAIRFSLENIELFKTQLRAILRASAFGKTLLMYPLITGVQELVQANKILEEVKKELKAHNLPFDEHIEVGIMIETPAAAEIIDLLAPHCAFFSLGTNDLIQYLLAADRNNDRIAYLYQPHHPAVLRTLKKIFTAAKEKGIKITVCGEMAADPLYIPLLLGLGADALSVTPGSIPEIKHTIRTLEFKDATNFTQAILQETNPTIIIELLRDFYFQNIGKSFTE